MPLLPLTTTPHTAGFPCSFKFRVQFRSIPFGIIRSLGSPRYIEYRVPIQSITCTWWNWTYFMLAVFHPRKFGSNPGFRHGCYQWIRLVVVSIGRLLTEAHLLLLGICSLRIKSDTEKKFVTLHLVHKPVTDKRLFTNLKGGKRTRYG
jgi:hypothetical protein